MSAVNNKSKFLVISALLAIYIFWGGTYLAMKIGIETIPPFILGGIRFFIAGLILYIGGIIQGQKKPQRINWLYASILGFLMLFISQGGIIWAQQYIPSGIASVIFATVPLWMTLIACLSRREKKPNLPTILGLLIGFAGIVLQMKGYFSGAVILHEYIAGYIVLILAAVLWAWGSIYSLVFPLPESPFMSIAMQMLTGGTFFLAASLLTGEWNNFNIFSASNASLLSLGYLIIFGSIIGFGAYIWLLQSADITLVSTYAYVNPIVAVFLGCALAGETLTANDAAAAVLIIISVIIISMSYNNAA